MNITSNPAKDTKNAITPCSYVITAGAIHICEPWHCWLCIDCTHRHVLPLPHFSSDMRRTMLGTDEHSWHVQSGCLVNISGHIFLETALTQLEQNANEAQTLNTNMMLLRSVLSICFFFVTWLELINTWIEKPHWNWCQTCDKQQCSQRKPHPSMCPIGTKHVTNQLHNHHHIETEPSN